MVHRNRRIISLSTILRILHDVFANMMSISLSSACSTKDFNMLTCGFSKATCITSSTPPPLNNCGSLHNDYIT